MKPRIAILAALPREIDPLIKKWPLRAHSVAEGWTIAENDRAIAICAGMGRERVTYALELAKKRGPLRAIVSAGYAGALRPEISRSSIYWPSLIIDAATGEGFSCDGGRGTLVTADHVVNEDEKAQMAARWNADLVDMETATIARLSQLEEISFRSVRVVSDELVDRLPNFKGFVNRNGGIRQAAMALHLVVHPIGIPTAVRFAGRSRQASEKLATALYEAMEVTE